MFENLFVYFVTFVLKKEINLRLYLIFSLAIINVNIFAQDIRYDTVKLFYPIDKTELEASHQKKLDSILLMLNRSKKVKISITGYADFLGTNPHNVDLSVERANKVKKYLATKGFDTTRVSECGGRGALSGITKNKKDKGVPEHRRVDVVVGWLVGKKPVPKVLKPKAQEPVKEAQADNKVAVKLSTVDAKTLKTGDKIILDNLNFNGGQHTLLPSSYPTVQRLVSILHKNPGLKISIEGHICCDSISVDGYDNGTGQLDLSVARAHYIYEQLIYQGIEASRLSYRGFGGKIRLIKDEKTEEDRSMNRRVEIRVVENGD